MNDLQIIRGLLNVVAQAQVTVTGAAVMQLAALLDSAHRRVQQGEQEEVPDGREIDSTDA